MTILKHLKHTCKILLNIFTPKTWCFIHHWRYSIDNPISKIWYFCVDSWIIFVCTSKYPWCDAEQFCLASPAFAYQRALIWMKSCFIVQQYTHKLQHLNIATYSEITTFSRNQTTFIVFFKLQLLRSCNVLLSTDVL